MILRVKIQANAKKNEFLEIIKIEDLDYLKIKINAPALDNRANQELVDFISSSFNLAKKDVKLIKGEKSQMKILELAIDEEVFVKILKKLNSGKYEK